NLRPLSQHDLQLPVSEGPAGEEDPRLFKLQRIALGKAGGLGSDPRLAGRSPAGKSPPLGRPPPLPRLRLKRRGPPPPCLGGGEKTDALFRAPSPLRILEESRPAGRPLRILERLSREDGARFPLQLPPRSFPKGPERPSISPRGPRLGGPGRRRA